MKIINYFTTGKKDYSGGVTGSSRVMGEDKNYYQLKPSILDNPNRLRRLKAGDTDRENFGEVIASHIGRALLDPYKVPEVSLVYDNTTKRVSVASQYLTGKSVRTLDEYAKENKIFPSSGKRHITFVAGAKQRPGEIGVDAPEMALLKESLAEAIVLSAVVGDHDVNPGNMLVITQKETGKETSHVARIDFGHALNDLLNASAINGGQLLDTENPILDFFNRSQVAGIGGSPSKLWRDYPGMVPSQAIVTALQKMSARFSSKAEGSGISAAKEEFCKLYTEMSTKNHHQGIEHLKKSLGAIYSNISGKRLNLTQEPENIIEETFNEVTNFTKKNGENLARVANIMQLQLDIDAALQSNDPSKSSQRMRELLKENKFPSKNGKIQWVKTSNSPAFSGSVDDYMLQKANQLIKENAKNAPAKRAEIIKNYRALRDDFLKISLPTQRNTASQFSRTHSHLTPRRSQAPVARSLSTPHAGSPNTAAKTAAFKKNFQASIRDRSDEPKKLDIQGLIAKLQVYIDGRIAQTNKKSIFSFYNKTDKIKAAVAFIEFLNGGHEAVLAPHLKVLKDGTLGDIINNYATTINPSALTKKNGLDILVNAVREDLALAENPPSSPHLGA